MKLFTARNKILKHEENKGARMGTSVYLGRLEKLIQYIMKWLVLFKGTLVQSSLAMEKWQHFIYSSNSGSITNIFSKPVGGLI
jgi:hypothetical protein